MSEVLRLRPDALEWRALEGEVLALDGTSSTYFALNRTGSVLWSALADGATRDELVRRLVDAFDVDDARATEDVDELIEALRRHGLLAE